MRVFEFTCGNYVYGIAAETKELAISEVDDQISSEYDKCEEIPDSKWDDKTITVYEDNDMTTEPIMMSINDVIIGNMPQVIYSNDCSLF